ncbi:hypothetical protein Nepgr_015345 [Nepenthes gracilis]|uniref:Uncharacterized protein n=1 Tax=Nepenthes gracilis TaxID=150966 RepID=A0AAD3SMM9_NEPGR|nr:hypothetical protein Nepgr_015345 [Nepenthes gracilis]
MDDDDFTTSNCPLFGSIDYDFMDELLDEGCWLHTADASNILQPGPSTSTAMRYPSYSSPILETNSTNLTSIPQQNTSQEAEETDIWGLPNIRTPISQNAKEVLASQSRDDNAIQALKSLDQSRNLLWEGDNVSKIWIAPETNPGHSSSVKDRLMRAIWHFKELNRNRDVLIQIWVPVRRGIKNFLTTFEQPYFHDPASTRLVNYRNVSEKYQFSADEDSKETLGLPGRVFVGKVPEWTPDVRFFRQDEYPRRNYAHMYDIRGSIALPVFEKGSGNCLGVVEIVTTTQKVNYHPEVQSVCRALEAVDLRSSEILSHSKRKSGINVHETTSPNILNILQTVCDKHDLPLAQAWAPCIQQGKGGCWNSDNNGHCISTVDSACYVRDPRVQDFHEACSEHHLLRGQGVVGKAFTTNQPCFATDITAFSKADYPLSHHAMLFGLRAAVAIPIRSAFSQSTCYILEFFLPLDCEDADLTLHSKIVESFSTVIRQGSQNFYFHTVEDIEQKSIFPFAEMPTSSDGKLNEHGNAKMSSLGWKRHWQEQTSWISHMIDAQKKDDPADKFTVMTKAFPDGGNTEQDSRLICVAEGGGDSSFEGHHTLGARKMGDKRKIKAQKTISLQVLRQYFSGSLKDAAKNMGVCPTTLKRICRQHGISRWPSRKIKKVSHSLRKLQLVIDSVQGAEGAIQLSSFYTNFPELNNPNLSSPNQFSSIQMNDQSKQLNNQPEGSIPSSGATTSKSLSPSSSQTSTSSHSFSTGAKSSSAMATAMGSLEALTAENPGDSSKRTQNEAEFHVSSQKAPALPGGSRSAKSLGEHALLESFPTPLLRSNSVAMQDGGTFKVKVTFGEEKIRFSISQNMGFEDLKLEIARRYSIEDVNNIYIKYLDDDKDWVLLTCDDDLDECIDIQSSSRSCTIKLSVHRALSLSSGSLLGNSVQS